MDEKVMKFLSKTEMIAGEIVILRSIDPSVFVNLSFVDSIICGSNTVRMPSPSILM